MNNKKISLFADTLREKLRSEVVTKAAKLGFSESGIADVQEYEDSIVINGQVFGKELKTQRAEFKEVVLKKGFDVVIDEITYTWFNRLVALKFMSANGYIPVQVFSSSIEGNNEPDLLTKCMGLDFMQIDKKKMLDLKTSGDDEELYKFLILSLCNHLNTIMPFLFEKIADYTELMFPEKLLRTDSILVDLNTIISSEDWKEVEVIGWLYQDYINPRKDEVFAKLKKNVKISKENIPAATQLFTPKWIVKYLVENSVGRLWLESNPNKELQDHFKYFIDQEYETPSDKVVSPEEITVLDPAMGSGHMLVYAFEVLYNIYKSQGYTESEIAQTIINENLYGLEIDNRATQLAGFAVVMKAREYDKDLFSKEIDLNLVAIQETPLECPVDEKKYPELSHLWKFFYDAKNYGSILNVQGYDFNKIDEEYTSFIKSYSLTAHFDRDLIAVIIKQAKIMSAKYDVVVTNPPYLGYRTMNKDLLSFLRKNYPEAKNDLFATFIVKCIKMCTQEKYVSMITMQSWMFLSSYENLRIKILHDTQVSSLLHFGAHAFEQIGGEVVSTAAFILKKNEPNGLCTFFDLRDEKNAKDKEISFLNKSNIYHINSAIFSELPGNPLAYWMTNKQLNCFETGVQLGSVALPRKGNSTSNNNRFLRLWSEVSFKRIRIGLSNLSDLKEDYIKWIPYIKGGGFRRWFGFQEYLVDWENDAYEMRQIPTAVIANYEHYLKKGLTWATINSIKFSLRYLDHGFIFDNGGCCLFNDDEENRLYFCGLLNSAVFENLTGSLNPTVNIQSGDVAKFPVIFPSDDAIKQKIDLLFLFSKSRGFSLASA